MVQSIAARWFGFELEVEPGHHGAGLGDCFLHVRKLQRRLAGSHPFGRFRLLNTVRTALRDPNWQGIAVLEGYLFAAVVYFVFSALMGAYSRFLEKRFRVGHD